MDTAKFASSFELHGKDQQVFILCTKGDVIIKKELFVEKLSANQLMLLPFGLESIQEKSVDCELHQFLFAKDLLNNGTISNLLPIYGYIINNPSTEVRSEKIATLVGLNSLLQKKCEESEDSYKQDIIGNIKMALLQEIYSIYQHAMRVDEPEIHYRKQLVQSFFQLVMQYHREERHTAFYADKLCLTPKYFSLIIKRITSKSVSQWINEILIANIKLMLKTSDMTAQQISNYFNFPNSSFFGRFFKQHTGQTTREYRLSA